MKTKQDLIAFLRNVAADMCGVYVVLNGGGISFINYDEIESLIDAISDSDHYGDIEILNKGKEYPDFKSVLKPEEYDGTEYFVRVCHLTGYNQENFDYQIQYWTV